jgi:hypothetical protein
VTPDEQEALEYQRQEYSKHRERLRRKKEQEKARKAAVIRPEDAVEILKVYARRKVTK